MPPATPRSSRRRWLLLGAIALIAWLGTGIAAACIATAPNPAAIPRAPALGSTVSDAETVTADGVIVRGWLATAPQGAERCVVLAAGIRGNRLATIERARWYLDHGWSALLVDLRGTGASEPTRISFGWHEAKDLAAWFRWLRGRGFVRIAAHGQSLGAAAIVYSATLEGAPAWDFGVLEACYGDLEGALLNRLPWVPWPGLALWPLRAAAGWLADIDGQALRPLEAIRSWRAPLLLVCGADDGKVGAGTSEALLAACASSDKRLVFVPGAAHVDLWSKGSALRDALASFASTR